MTVRRNNPTFQAPSFAPSYADVVKTISSTITVDHTPPPAERSEKHGYTTTNEELKIMLLRVKVTHPAILNSPPKQGRKLNSFFVQQLNMPRREIDDAMYLATLSQPNTILVTLSHYKFKMLLFRA